MTERPGVKRTAMLLFGFGLLLALAACRRRADDTPAVLTPTQIDDRIRPATVAILARYVASGTVQRMVPDTARLAAATREQSGLFDSSEERTQRFFNILLKDPASYLREGPSVKLSKTIGSLGTGFIVTPDGYILTNAHVVEPDPEDLKAAVVDSLAELVADDVKKLESEVEASLSDSRISDEATQRLTGPLAQLYARIQYNLALAEYDQPGHGDALTMFRALRDSHPDSAAVAEFVQRLSHQQQQPQADTISAAQTPATSSDASQDSPGSNTPLLLFGGVAVFLFLVVGIVLLARRK